MTTLPMAIPDAEISAVRFWLRVLAERYIAQQTCVKKWIGSALILGTRWNNIQPPTPAMSATMHSVTDGRKDCRQTDRQTDNSMMPIADHTV